MYAHRTLPALWLGLACTVSPTLADPPPAGLAVAEVTAPGTAVLRLAESDDGLHFDDTGKVFARNASSPDLVRLPNDQLLAVFSSRTVPDAAPSLFVSRSADDGRTWGRAEAVRFLRLRTDDTVTGPADLIVMPNGLVRMYFACCDAAAGRGRGSPPPVIASAVSRDGRSYQLDAAVQIACPRQQAPRPSAVVLRQGVLLYVSDAGMNDGRDRAARESGCQALVSRDGRHFEPSRRLREPAPAGTIIDAGRGELRLYYTRGGDVHCLVADDRMRWRPLPRPCLADAAEPAVVRRGDGSFLMIYAGPPVAAFDEGPPLVEAPEASGGLPADAESADSVDMWEPFTDAGVDSELASAGLGDDDVAGFEDEWGPPPVPDPDFQNPVDYVRWFEEDVLADHVAEGYEVFEAFDVESEADPAWQTITDNMIRARGEGTFKGPVGPWDPIDHPEWEANYQGSGDLLAWYRDTALSGPLFPAPILPVPSDPSRKPGYLVDLCLPSFADIRALDKANLSNAWRLEAGSLDPDAMLDALETTLSAGSSCREDYTFIGNLVGIAEQTMAEDTARRALTWGVFQSPEEIRAALDTLRTRDQSSYGESRFLTWDHAVALEAVQNLGHALATGEAHLESFREYWGTNDEDTEMLRQLSLDDFGRIADELQAHWAETKAAFETGYPEVRPEDVERIALDRIERDPSVRLFIPSLARGYHLSGRQEASRRATQLGYAVHLFRSQTGRWPASLDELPAEDTEGVRTDPFTGRDFIYRPTRDGGFTIYTAFENGIDDGGTHAEDESGDYVFWPSQ